jgi:hypothetical protein
MRDVTDDGGAAAEAAVKGARTEEASPSPATDLRI